jgi:iron complex transport system ATP-binding protein
MIVEAPNLHETTTAATTLRAVDLSIGYRSRKTQRIVLDHLNVSVQSGELVCLLGPNGIGKSTFLRTLAKIQKPLAGKVELGGVDLQSLSQVELARRMGVVLTERVAVGALPAYRLVELGRYPHLGWFGTLTARDHEVVQWAIECVRVQSLAMRDSSALSDGERQRFMIARALAQEPLVLLLDEPTAFLDVPSRVELMGLLRHLAREEGIAIILSTHDLELALRMADTIWLVMPEGRLCSGAPEDVVLSGRIASAFQSENISFHSAERTFRLLAGRRGRASVRGDGLTAVLAAAVLEREGYELCINGRVEDVFLTVTVGADGSRWEAVAGTLRHHGETFAALAAFARRC